MTAKRSAHLVDLDSGEGRGVAATACLEGFELVEFLEKHAVEVGLVPLDVFDGAGGEGAVKASLSAVEAATETGELVEVVFRWPEGVALEADQAVEAPEGEGDAVGQDELEVADGVEGLELAGEVGFPVRLLLDLGEDRVSGEDAVAKGVARGRAPDLGWAAAGAGGRHEG
jgi:hypothetical protein